MTITPLDLPSYPPIYDSGSEALLWEHPSDPRCLLKVFRQQGSSQPQAKSRAESAHLNNLLNIGCKIRPSEWLRLTSSTSWLVDVYGRAEDAVEAIRIARAPDEFYLEYTDQFGSQKVPQELSFLISSALQRPGITQVPYRQISLEDRIEIAYDFSQTISLIWELGFAFTDISARNILWSVHRRPRCFLIDIESSVPIGSKGIQTPDWFPPQKLGNSIHGNRAQASLVIWRILAQSLTELPNTQSQAGYLDQVSASLRHRIVQVWTNGQPEDWSSLVKELATTRADHYKQSSLNESISSGYARLVLSEELSGRLAPDVRDLALHQLELELRLENSARRSRRRQRQSACPFPGFEFDLLPDLNPNSGQRSLQEKLLEGDYEGVFNIVIAEDDLTSNIFLPHVLQVLKPRLTNPRHQPTVSLQGSEIHIAWSWSNIPAIDVAQIQVMESHGTEVCSYIANRSSDESRVRIRGLPKDKGPFDLLITLLSSRDCRAPKTALCRWRMTIPAEFQDVLSEQHSSLTSLPRQQVVVQPRNPVPTRPRKARRILTAIKQLLKRLRRR